MREILLDIPDTSLSQYTISGPATGQGRYIRQTSCYGGVGIVTLRLEPHAGPVPSLLLWQVSDEQIPEEFMPGIVAGVQQAMQRGHAGVGPLTHIKVAVVDGAYHPVDSLNHAYTRATLLAFADALAHTELVPYVEEKDA